jgi:hypothetical protein
LAEAETPETGREIQDDVRRRGSQGEGGKLLVAAVEVHVVEGPESQPVTNLPVHSSMISSR